ncbi:hypothetical protein [Paraburkholderia fungorum]|uniref:Uncharacterized protein n=1 Tax=Paraburkholderia fungorum TaxID=134537 RepID=A0A420FC85_9BURK|nr:hypothetical protein [Paraburkholderia fungorum]RKF30544.1 hypothetical protein BCY88_12835 [Paraburkholderia fungorum]
MVTKEEIGLEQARGIAREQALLHLGDAVDNECLDALHTHYLEAKHCWFFFTNPAIALDDNAHLGIKWAYAVSKHGTFSLIQDFSGDPEQLRAYLLTMSDYFARKSL